LPASERCYFSGRFAVFAARLPLVRLAAVGAGVAACLFAARFVAPFAAVAAFPAALAPAGAFTS
jgi:hypothetical protein